MMKIKNIIVFLGQVVSTLASYAFFYGFRFFLRQSAKKEYKKRSLGSHAPRWRELSETLSDPAILPWAMVSGPRWNCHAVIASAGPFTSASDIDVDINIDSANNSSDKWTIIIYSHRYETKGFISSMAAERQRWSSVHLAEGTYSIVLRYYGCRDIIVFPEIKIDGKTAIASRSMRREHVQYPQYLNTIKNKYTIFYYWLNYYVYNLLRWESYLPASFVRKEYLPIGNPDTKFVYGSLRKGDKIAVTLAGNNFGNINLYITTYNLCSFPVHWETISSATYVSPKAPKNGYYLIRAHLTSDIQIKATITH